MARHCIDVIFDFVPVYIKALPGGEIQYTENNTGHRVMQFRIRKKKAYSRLMTMVANDLMIAAGTVQ